MKYLFLFFLLCINYAQLYANDITGSWSSHLTDEPNMNVNIRKNYQGLYLITISYDGDVISFVETKREQEVVNNEIEYCILFDCSGNSKPEYFKNGISITYFSKTNGEVSNEMNIRCRDYYYRYDAWNVYRTQTNQNKTQSGNYSSNNHNTYNSLNNNNNITEERVPNISVTFGRKGGWTYRLNSNGTFSYHNYTTDNYGRKIKDISITHGTYFITKGYKSGTYEYGGFTVHLRFENGKQEIAHLKYEGNRAVLISKFYGGVGKRNEEMVGDY